MEPNFQVLPPESRVPPPNMSNSAAAWSKTIFSMLLSAGAFMVMGWSWNESLGLVVLIFVHEMGHAISARYYGISVSAPMFTPFVGAYVLLKNRPRDPWQNAVISYAGPLAGGLGGWVCYWLASTLNSDWLMNTAFYTFILNLGNLLPVPPLDGSHIWIAFSRTWTPQMPPADRYYMGLYLAALIAGLLLGCLHCWRYLHGTM
jgi:Zn-dependent protease